MSAELGPLPAPYMVTTLRDLKHTKFPLYEANQMRAYAAAEVAKERDRCAKEAEHWQAISAPGHACGQYIAAAIRGGKS